MHAKPGDQQYHTVALPCFAASLDLPRNIEFRFEFCFEFCFPEGEIETELETELETKLALLA
jgi:hypothetical protein